MSDTCRLFPEALYGINKESGERRQPQGPLHTKYASDYGNTAIESRKGNTQDLSRTSGENKCISRDNFRLLRTARPSVSHSN